jgi:hypothetical protein
MLEGHATFRPVRLHVQDGGSGVILGMPPAMREIVSITVSLSFQLLAQLRRNDGNVVVDLIVLIDTNFLLPVDQRVDMQTILLRPTSQ